jgi:hypothetical protein
MKFDPRTVFMGDALLVNMTDKLVEKHGTHDQKTHGNWATGSVPTSIVTSINAIGQEIQKITYGDIVIERDKPGIVRDSDDLTRTLWAFSAGASAMRFVSSRIMGIDVTNLPKRVDENDQKSLIEGTVPKEPEIVGGYSSQKSDVPKWISGAYTLMEDVRESTGIPVELHRGILVRNDSPILNIKTGQILEMPLSSTTDKRRVAQIYAEEYAQDLQTPVYFSFVKGTKATPIRGGTMSDGSLVMEYVTQGKFEVVSLKSTVVSAPSFDADTGIQNRQSGAIEVTLRQREVFSIDKGGYEAVKP